MITLTGRNRTLRAVVGRAKRMLALMRDEDRRRLDAERFGLWDMDPVNESDACPECGSLMIANRCTNKARHNGGVE